MILYHVSTTYHLLRCIVHKLAYYPDTPCELLIVEFILPASQRETFKQRLEQTGWFQTVTYVPEGQFKPRRRQALTEKSSDNEILKAVRQQCLKFEQWFSADLHQYTKIYVAADQWSLGIYLLYHNIPYVYMEDASGMLSQEDRYLNIIRHTDLHYYIINNYLLGAGRNPIVLAHICDMNNQSPDFADSKAIHFSIGETIRSKLMDRCHELLDFYQVPVIPSPETAPHSLLLTQFVQTLALPQLDVQEIITTLLVDYICPEHQLIIKPHPKDQWLNYRRIFPDAIILPDAFPAELIPFLTDDEIDIALTASSTSIGGLLGTAVNSYTFGTDIETNWDLLHPMYAVAYILARTGEYYQITTKNINALQMTNFLRSEQVLPDEESGTAVIIDGAPLPAAPEDYGHVLHFWMNCDMIPLAFTPAGESLLAIRVQVIPAAGSLLRERNYYLYLSCLDLRLRRLLTDIHHVKPLTFSKGRLVISVRSTSQPDD